MHHHLKWILIKSALFLSFANQAQAQMTPKVTTEVKPALDAHLFYKQDEWDHVLKYRWAPDAEENFQKISFSSRFDLGNLYKVGVYASRSFGERHFEDWQKINGSFQWRDLEGDGEFHLGGLVQKKWPLSQTFGSEVRIKFERHLNQEMNFLRIRPGLTWMATPLWTTYLRYEAYHLINNETSTLYRWGAYLGGLYRGYSKMMFGPFVRYHRQEWWTSPSFKKEMNSKYRSHEHHYSVGLSFVYFL